MNPTPQDSPKSRSAQTAGAINAQLTERTTGPMTTGNGTPATDLQRSIDSTGLPSNLKLQPEASSDVDVVIAELAFSASETTIFEGADLEVVTGQPNLSADPTCTADLPQTPVASQADGPSVADTIPLHEIQVIGDLAPVELVAPQLPNSTDQLADSGDAARAVQRTAQEAHSAQPAQMSTIAAVTPDALIPDALETDLPVPPIVVVAHPEPASLEATEDARTISTVDESTHRQSWVARCFEGGAAFLSHLFGIASMIMLLAVTASIPIVQLISFGYLLEVSGRLARGQKLRDAMVGLRKAAVVGGAVAGIWICLLPIRALSNVWFDAYLIDPTSTQTGNLRFLQLTLIVLTLGHITAALVCGGKLRYFFWPLVAPVSFGVWSMRRLAGIGFFRKILDVSLGWISPSLPAEICEAKPIGDWFLPMIVWQRLRSGQLYSQLRDGLWDFVLGLRPGYYFLLGAKGFVGTLGWLLLPTSLLVISSYAEGVVAGVTFLLGLLFAIPIFAGVPFLQAHFAKDGDLVRFLEPWNVFKNFGRAPIAHTLSLLIMLVLALPLFLLKIESIPSELLWTLSLVFVVFSWPAKVVVGLAYRRGASKQMLSRWWIRYPFILLTIPISFSFALFFTATRYITWNGALSLFENHVFLLPAPFWL